MRTTRIYTSDTLSPNSELTLGEAASRHLHTVLRFSVGDALVLFNGDGFDYLATITSISKKKTSVNITVQQINVGVPTLKIHLYQGICRGEKMDWAIQKATELGVSEITPMFSTYCNVKIAADRWSKKLQHWQNIANSACEQSGRADIVAINLPQEFAAIIDADNGQQKFILCPEVKNTLPVKEAMQACTLLVGPEGGFSAEEVKAAEAKYFCSIRLGPRVLRSETAGLAAISVLQSQYGDWL
jgi:16S rRNA (uracil1498-N3)-methyltransferase